MVKDKGQSFSQWPGGEVAVKEQTCTKVGENSSRGMDNFNEPIQLKGFDRVCKVKRVSDNRTRTNL